MESKEEEEILLDYDWDEEIDGPMPGYSRSDGPAISSNFLFDGLVQDVPIARGSTVVTSMGLTSPSKDASSDDGLLDPIFPGSSEAAVGDIMVVGPPWLHERGL